MEIANEKKAEVLMAVLAERYSASHHMRERSTQFSLWILGLGIALAWYLLSEDPLPASQKWILLAFVVVMGALAVWFTTAISRGFDANRNVMISAEAALGLYTKGAYVPDVSVLPEPYGSRKKRWSWHFVTLTLLILAVLGMLVALIIVSPCADKVRTDKSGSGIIMKGGQNG